MRPTVSYVPMNADQAELLVHLVERLAREANVDIKSGITLASPEGRALRDLWCRLVGVRERLRPEEAA